MPFVTTCARTQCIRQQRRSFVQFLRVSDFRPRTNRYWSPVVLFKVSRAVTVANIEFSSFRALYRCHYSKLLILFFSVATRTAIFSLHSQIVLIRATTRARVWNKKKLLFMVFGFSAELKSRVEVLPRWRLSTC